MKIITMVGTSLFDNYLDNYKDDNSFRNYFEDLRNKDAKEYENEKDRISRLKEKINKWVASLESVDNKRNISAETKSIVQLRKRFKDSFEIHLLSSDTIISKIAGEILKEILPNLLDEPKIDLCEIEHLQVQDSHRFRSGMVSLVNKIYQIAGEYWEDIIINITGGYKATIPYLIILAQVNRCPIYYIFERTDAMIEIPYIPLDIKWEIFKKYEGFFARLEREEILKIEGFSSEDYKEVNSLLESVENLISLNPLGIVLWERYKQRYSFFYISEFVEQYIESDANYRRIAEKSLLELKRRVKQNPNDRDLNHSLSGVDLGGFKCFKHKEENLQVRFLYKTEERTTRYESKEIDIYVGLIRIGQDVHNVESEYVSDFVRNLEKIRNLEEYKLFKLKKEE